MAVVVCFIVVCVEVGAVVVVVVVVVVGTGHRASRLSLKLN